MKKAPYLLLCIITIKPFKDNLQINSSYKTFPLPILWHNTWNLIDENKSFPVFRYCCGISINHVTLEMPFLPLIGALTTCFHQEIRKISTIFVKKKKSALTGAMFYLPSLAAVICINYFYIIAWFCVLLVLILPWWQETSYPFLPIRCRTGTVGISTSIFAG